MDSDELRFLLLEMFFHTSQVDEVSSLQSIFLYSQVPQNHLIVLEMKVVSDLETLRQL